MKNAENNIWYNCIITQKISDYQDLNKWVGFSKCLALRFHGKQEKNLVKFLCSFFWSVEVSAFLLVSSILLEFGYSFLNLSFIVF
jgi:hypothetical protein